MTSINVQRQIPVTSVHHSVSV